jgi:hypothetical protein
MPHHKTVVFTADTVATLSFLTPHPQIQLARSHLIDLKGQGRSEFLASSKTIHIDFKEKKE